MHFSDFILFFGQNPNEFQEVAALLYDFRT